MAHPTEYCAAITARHSRQLEHQATQSPGMTAHDTKAYHAGDGTAVLLGRKAASPLSRIWHLQTCVRWLCWGCHHLLPQRIWKGSETNLVCSPLRNTCLVFSLPCILRKLLRTHRGADAFGRHSRETDLSSAQWRSPALSSAAAASQSPRDLFQEALSQTWDLPVFKTCSHNTHFSNLFPERSEVFPRITWYSAVSLLLVSPEFFNSSVYNSQNSFLVSVYFYHLLLSFWESEVHFSLFPVLPHVLWMMQSHCLEVLIFP